MIALAILGPVILAEIVAVVVLLGGKPRQALDYEARSWLAIQWGAAVTSA